MQLQGGLLFLPPPKKQSPRHGGEFFDSVFLDHFPPMFGTFFLGGGGGKNSGPPCMRLSKISVTFKTHNDNDSKSGKLAMLDKVEINNAFFPGS